MFTYARVTTPAILSRYHKSPIAAKDVQATLRVFTHGGTHTKVSSRVIEYTVSKPFSIASFMPFSFFVIEALFYAA
jgi:hypothetical protein